MNEWIDIKGYEGRYQVNIKGEVRSLERKEVYRDGSIHIIKGKMLKPIKWGSYLGYALYDGNNRFNAHHIHRLVAIHFIPNPNNYNEVNHIDGDKMNNSIENLEWCSHRYNIQHAYDTGLHGGNKKGVMVVETGEVFRSMSSLAIHLGCSVTLVSDAVRGKYGCKTCKGYHLKMLK